MKDQTWKAEITSLGLDTGVNEVWAQLIGMFVLYLCHLRATAKKLIGNCFSKAKVRTNRRAQREKAKITTWHVLGSVVPDLE